MRIKIVYNILLSSNKRLSGLISNVGIHSGLMVTIEHWESGGLRFESLVVPYVFYKLEINNQFSNCLIISGVELYPRQVLALRNHPR